jgi:hypothetical protein
MGTSKASSVAPLAAAEGAAAVRSSGEQGFEPPRDFHFAVTWVTLFAHLDLIQSSGRRSRIEAAPTLALVPVVVPALIERPPAALGDTAWEMVVPKMIRSGSGDFTPAGEIEPT